MSSWSMLSAVVSVIGFVLDDSCGESRAGSSTSSSTSVGDCGSRVGNVPMPLHLVDKERAAATGGVCLDGSPPGYYFEAAAAGSGKETSWLLYFKGGGWCYDEHSCASRAKEELGSATKFPQTFAFSGLMDSDHTGEASPFLSPFRQAA